MTRGALVVALGLALVVPLGLTAQEHPSPAPVFGSGVSIVLLPVFVVDRDGRAVRGLQATDFAVQEDGRPVEVVSFRYVDTTEGDEQDDLPLSSAARRLSGSITLTGIIAELSSWVK